MLNRTRCSYDGYSSHFVFDARFIAEEEGKVQVVASVCPQRDAIYFTQHNHSLIFWGTKPGSREEVPLGSIKLNRINHQLLSTQIVIDGFGMRMGLDSTVTRVALSTEQLVSPDVRATMRLTHEEGFEVKEVKTGLRAKYPNKSDKEIVDILDKVLGQFKDTLF